MGSCHVNRAANSHLDEWKSKFAEKYQKEVCFSFFLLYDEFWRVQESVPTFAEEEQSISWIYASFSCTDVIYLCAKSRQDSVLQHVEELARAASSTIPSPSYEELFPGPWTHH